MIARFGRWFAVWFAVWSLRHGVSLADVTDALASAYKRRDDEWRAAVLADALMRNRNRLIKRINA